MLVIVMVLEESRCRSLESGGKTTHINKFITRLRWQMTMAVGVWARRSLLLLSEISVTTSLRKSFEQFMTCVTKINRETSH